MLLILSFPHFYMLNKEVEGKIITAEKGLFNWIYYLYECLTNILFKYICATDDLCDNTIDHQYVKLIIGHFDFELVN